MYLPLVGFARHFCILHSAFCLRPSVALGGFARLCAVFCLYFYFLLSAFCFRFAAALPGLSAFCILHSAFPPVWL
jgi:hypothetical protein